MHARRMGVAVVALCALFVSFWMLPAATASEEAREPAKPLAEMAVGAGRVDWQPAGDYEHLTLTVAGPGGIWIRNEFAAGQPASLSLFDQNGQQLPDGAYTYELRLVSRKEGNLPERSLLQAGAISVRDGRFVTSARQQEEEIESVTESQIQNITAATQVIPEPLVVQGGACIGSDCTSADAPPYSSLKLKSDINALVFEDVFTCCDPSRDWALQANDFPGGLDHFFFYDIDAGTQPFTVQGNAPSFSLVVGGSSGNVGVGTALPAQAVHVARTDTPTLRLEDTFTGSFPGVRTWDIGANSTELFVKDVTNSSSVPLRIKAGAPSNSLVVSNAGQVGIGTASPAAALQVNAGEVRFPPGSGLGGFTHFNYSGDGKNYIRGITVLADNGGWVGIGTATPAVLLDVKANASSQAVARLQNNSATGYSGTEYLDNAGNVGLFFGLDNANGNTRLNSVANKPISILTNSTERMRITSAGNVGLGTTSPADKLHLFDNTNIGTIVRAENTNSGANAVASFRAQSDTAVVHFRAHGSGRTISHFGVVLGGWSELVQDIGNGLLIGTQNNTPIIMGTNNTNRLQIDGSGNVGIGTTSPAHPLQMASGAHVTAGGVWTNASSRELKHDIQSLEADEARSTLARLEPVRFRYNADPADESLGFIAEDVPDLVSTVDHKTLSPMDLVAVLTRVVQEQQKAIGDLQATVTSLSEKLATMEERKEVSGEPR